MSAEIMVQASKRYQEVIDKLLAGETGVTQAITSVTGCYANTIDCIMRPVPGFKQPTKAQKYDAIVKARDHYREVREAVFTIAGRCGIPGGVICNGGTGGSNA